MGIDAPQGGPLGTRVRIREDYWDPELAGRQGTVASPPAGVAVAADSCWVELEVQTWSPGVVDAAEVPADSLMPL